jgi:hypothetical protein
LLYGLWSGSWLHAYNLAFDHHVGIDIRRYGSIYSVYQMQGHANLLGFQDLIRSCGDSKARVVEHIGNLVYLISENLYSNFLPY